MTDDKIAKLQESYPFMFTPRTIIECGNGWFNLVDLACRAIKREVENAQYLGVEVSFTLSQVKEKFGGLRIYYDNSCDMGITVDPNVMRKYWNSDGKISGIVRMAELYSYHVCEECGERGDCDPKAAYLKTECAKCWSLRVNAYNDHQPT